jgi:large subunit ribosomal protein L6
MTASRVARKPVIIPSGVEVKLHDHKLDIKGPKGHLTFPLHPLVQVVINDGKIQVENNKDSGYIRRGSGSRLKKAIAGTVRAQLANAIHGVVHQFEKKLLLVGVGYKAQAKGKTLGLTLGLSHPVDFQIPAGITVETPTPGEIILKGSEIDKLGLAAATIRANRKPEPYKGKGIRTSTEVIVRKETKKK